MTTLAKYRSHRVVMAGKILGFKGEDDGAFDTLSVEGLYGPVDIKPAAGFFARGRPSVGDFYLKYEDGYDSWRPRAAFEAGYTRVEEAG